VASSKPRKGTFIHPEPRQGRKAAAGVGPLDDLDPPIAPTDVVRQNLRQKNAATMTHLRHNHPAGDERSAQ